MQIEDFLNALNLKTGLKTAKLIDTFYDANNPDPKENGKLVQEETLILEDAHPSPFKSYSMTTDKLGLFSSPQSKLKELVFGKNINLTELELEISKSDIILDLSRIETHRLDLRLTILGGCEFTLLLPRQVNGTSLHSLRLKVFNKLGEDPKPAVIKTNITKIKTFESLYLNNVIFKTNNGSKTKYIDFTPSGALYVTKDVSDKTVDHINTRLLSYNTCISKYYPASNLEWNTTTEKEKFNKLPFGKSSNAHPFMKKILLQLYLDLAPNRIFSLLNNLYYGFSDNGYYKVKVDKTSSVEVLDVVINNTVDPTLTVTAQDLLIEDIVLYDSDSGFLLQKREFNNVKVGDRFNLEEPSALTMRPIVDGYDRRKHDSEPFNLAPIIFSEF